MKNQVFVVVFFFLIILLLSGGLFIPSGKKDADTNFETAANVPYMVRMNQGKLLAGDGNSSIIVAPFPIDEELFLDIRNDEPDDFFSTVRIFRVNCGSEAIDAYSAVRDDFDREDDGFLLGPDGYPIAIGNYISDYLLSDAQKLYYETEMTSSEADLYLKFICEGLWHFERIEMSKIIDSSYVKFRREYLYDE